MNFPAPFAAQMLISVTAAAAYLLFVLILLFRPQGLFGRRTT